MFKSVKNLKLILAESKIKISGTVNTVIDSLNFFS